MIERISETAAVDADGNVVPPDDIDEFQTFPDHEPDWDVDEIDASESLEAGPSVDIRARARFLLTALEHYALGNRLSGYKRSGKRMGNERAVNDGMHNHYKLGDAALRSAYGYDELLAAGEDRQDLDDDFVKVRFEFKNLYMNPADSTATTKRAAYRRKLEKAAK